MSIRNGLADAIGNTPLIRLSRFSDQTGCEILGKAEFMNPGQSVKDRAGKQMILEAEKRGDLKPGGLVVEGDAEPARVDGALAVADRHSQAPGGGRGEAVVQAVHGLGAAQPADVDTPHRRPVLYVPARGEEPREIQAAEADGEGAAGQGVRTDGGHAGRRALSRRGGGAQTHGSPGRTDRLDGASLDAALCAKANTSS